MIQTALQRDRTARWTFTLSLALHLLIFFILNSNYFFRVTLHEATPYYVDIVSLPTLDSAPAGGGVTAPPSPLPPARANIPVPVKKPDMALPVKQTRPSPVKTTPAPAQNQREQEEREFSEKMNRLERAAAARHQAEALATLQKKVAEKNGAGEVSAAGTNAGSDYGSYIQSRLKDALSTTIAFQSSKPEAAVRIFIDPTGKLIKYVMERPSADKLFNSSVIRAIEKAKADFPPVPSGKGFDKLYVFNPQEVQK
jgi:colicin import membrane protein